MTLINQPSGIGNPIGIVPSMTNQMQEQFVVQPAPVCIHIFRFRGMLAEVNLEWNWDSAGYAPPREATASHPQAHANVGLDQTQVFDATVTEGLRRLAGRYVNDPDSLVNAVRLEPSPSGRFRIIIMLEIAGIL
jgi:hypothetical protein